jgi:hypothetical protein
MRTTFSRVVIVSAMTAAFLLPAQGRQASGSGVAKQGSAGDPSQVPTPRTADGHPELTGMWGGRNFPGPAGGGGRLPNLATATDETKETVTAARDGSITNLEEDGYLINHANPNKPWYKPEYWEKVRHLDEIGYRTPLDPGYSCNENPGLTRLGPPVEIVQVPQKILLLYQTPGDGGNSASIIREIPTDGRALPSPDDYEGTKVMGTSVGHWEGDTLVIQTVDTAGDASWLGTPGWFHSGEMTVTERLSRVGNILTLDMTVEDPEVLLRPFVLPTQRVELNTNPNALFTELSACAEHDGEHLVGTQ